MKRVQNLRQLLCLPLIVGLAGCASPHVVEQYQIGDRKLSCPQLEEQMREADDFKVAARKDGGVTGTNAAALVFFWPALISTAMNVGEAVDAAEERKGHLYGIYVQKNCEGYVSRDSAAIEGSQVNTSKNAAADSRLAELDEMRDQGIVTEEDYIVIKRKLLGL